MDSTQEISTSGGCPAVAETVFALNPGGCQLDGKARLAIVEGYNEALALSAIGIPAVAVQSGSLSLEQVRGAQEQGFRSFVVLLNGDGAGAAGAEQAVRLLLENDTPCAVAALPAGYNPDTYIAEHGKEALASLIDEARGAARWLPNAIAARHNLDDDQGRRLAVADGAEAGQAIPNPLDAQLYNGELANALNLTGGELADYLARLQASKERITLTAAYKDLAAGIIKAVAQDRVESLGAGLVDKARRLRDRQASRRLTLPTSAQLHERLAKGAIG